MKRYITYILATMSLAWMVSCSTDDGLTNPSEAGRVALQFQSSTMTRSAGVESYNENLIASIDCYFYPTGSTGNAVWHYHAEPNAQNSYTIQNILMPAGQMNAVFSTGTTGTMYVIANYTGGDLPNADNLDNSSIAELKQKVISTQWPLGNNWAAPASFVMDGQAEVNKSGSDITGSVSLVRSAAKIELTITNIQDEVTNSEGKKYVPAIGENGGSIGLTMHNAATSSWIDNAWDGTALAYNADAAAHTSLTGYGFTPVADADGQYKQTKPFYSYPTHWGPSGEAYLLLVVPWQEVDDEGKNVGTPQSCYYEIPIGKLKDNVLSEHIARNNHYQISINVGTLGSFVLQELLTLEPSYMVVDWTSGNIEAQIKDQQYLVVDETTVTMNNVNTYSVAYASSHAVSAVITKVTKPNLMAIPVEDINIYSGNGLDTVTPSSSISGNRNPFSVKVENGKIVLTHNLDNNQNNDTFDYYQYTIEVLVTNECGMTQKIVFTQNPAMYIIPSLNTGYNATTGSDLGKKGNVIINNNTSQTSSWNVVNGLGSGSGSSSSPYMYVVTLTSFNDSKYVIADPRAEDVNNLNYNSWVSTTALYGTSPRKLTYYYPTLTGADYANFIAPKFRICSGYGRLGSVQLSQETAQYRCASYQEDGYPAGRWRLPTAAELQYIGQLCANDRIPPLFSSGNTYWSASGGFKYNDSNGEFTSSSSANYVRCVYDDWYWGSEPIADKTKFTWGDMPR